MSCLIYKRDTSGMRKYYEFKMRQKEKTENEGKSESRNKAKNTF